MCLFFVHPNPTLYVTDRFRTCIASLSSSHDLRIAESSKNGQDSFFTNLIFRSMIINLTCDCKCGGSIDKNIGLGDWDIDQSGFNHYESFVCDSCTKDYQATISREGGVLRVKVPHVFNLGWEQVGFAHLSYNDQAVGHDESDDELTWVIKSTVQLENFKKILTDVVALVRADVKIPNISTLHNMAYAQVVTAVEAYLSGIFIRTVVNSMPHMRKLVETDPEFAKRKFCLKEIFTEWESLKIVVARYLHDLIFHDLKKIKPMFKDVLDIDFGDIGWLYKAVLLRHDCVHRNGVDKAGKLTGIGQQEIESLVRECIKLIVMVDKEVGELFVPPEPTH